MSFKNQVFSTFSAVLIIPLIIFAIFVYINLTHTKKEELLEERSTVLVQLSSNIDLIVDDAARSAMSILFNNQELVLLRKYATTNSNVKVRTEENDIENYLQSVVYRKQQIEAITYISAKGHVFTTIHDSEHYDFVDVDQLPYIKQAETYGGSSFLIRDDQMSYYKLSKPSHISLVRAIRDPINFKILGVMKIDFQNAYIDKLVEPLASGHYAVVSKDDTVLLESGYNELYTQCETNGNNELCLQVTSANAKVQLLYMLPQNYFKQDAKKLGNWLFLYVIFILCLSVLVTYYTVKKLLTPLTILKNYITSYQRSKIPVQSEEMQRVRNSYGGLIVEIERLVHEIYDATKKNVEMEYKVRQAQMDPHFLFNTLEMLNMKALANKDLEMSDMIVQLSKCFRYHIKGSDIDITLEDEVAFAKAYVAIMELRLGERLDVEWLIHISNLQVIVPKYLIQPLIENAIIHGMRQNGKPLHIIISITEKVEFIEVKVVDDGRGMKKSRLDKIQKVLRNSKKADDEMGIALLNIHQLLKYGLHKQNTLLVESVYNEGTTITIHLYGGIEHGESNDSR